MPVESGLASPLYEHAGKPLGGRGQADLGPKGWEEATLNRQDALAEISAARKLRFQPGTKWGIQIPTTYSSTW